jgi:hypothetical protein
MATRSHRRYRGFDLLFAVPVIVALLALHVGCNEAPAADPINGKQLQDRLTAAEARVKELEAEIATLRAQLAAAQKPAEPVGATAAANKANPAEPVNGLAGAPRDPAEPAGAAAAAAQPDPVEPINGMITLTPNPAMKGVMGRVVVAFPKDAGIDQTHTAVVKQGDKKNSASGYGNFAADLLPGTYDVTISGATVTGVEVKSRHDSNIAVGVLRTSADAQTHISVKDKAGKKQLTSAYGSQQFGLPIGTYTVTVSGQSMPVEIKKGATTDF